MKNKIIKIVVIVLIIASVGFNIYALIWKSIEQKIMVKGAKQMLNIIANNIKQNGKYPIDILDKEGEVSETIILVPQVQIQIEEPEK